MSFVGIDLAWKATNRTGLAVVDGSGRLVGSTSVQGDDDIASWLETEASSPVIVAVDAPLIVPNATGSRLPEKLIGSAYGRYSASAYPANRANPLFNPPRAQILAERFGWDVDPALPTDAGRTICIEVYPHPALVGLFRLPQRILYKKGKDRQRGFTELARCLESIAELKLAETARWHELTATIADPRPGDLNRVEDEMDAILCAHLAWLWHHRPASLQVYGSVRDGYIVAPPPPTHEARRTTSAKKTATSAHIQAFDRRMHSPEMRFTYQLTFSMRMIGEIASRYKTAQDGADSLIPYLMLDAFFVHVRLLSEFLTRTTSRLDFGPAEFGLANWSAPKTHAARRLGEYWDVASKYVVHYGLPRVPPSIEELDEFDVSAAAFRRMANDVLEVLETFVTSVEATVETGAELTVERMRSESLRHELDVAKSLLDSSDG